MDTIEAQVWTDTGKRDGKGRRIVKDEERERLLALYDGSGLTQAEFCRREGLNYHTFVAWLGRRRKGRSPESEGVPGFHRINLIHGTNPHDQLEAVLADGTVLRGSRPEALAELVRVLRDG